MTNNKDDDRDLFEDFVERFNEFIETERNRRDNERRELLDDRGWQNWPPTLVVVATAAGIIASHWWPHMI
jgi:hypothetical protein